MSDSLNKLHEARSASSRFRFNVPGSKLKISSLRNLCNLRTPSPWPSPVRRARGSDQGLSDFVPPILRNEPNVSGSAVIDRRYSKTRTKKDPG
jgi:hypothetical protein